MRAAAPAAIELPGQRGEGVDEPFDARLRVTDGDEEDQPDVIAHLRPDAKAVAQDVFGREARDAKTVDVDDEFRQIERVDAELCRVEHANTRQGLQPSSSVGRQRDRPLEERFAVQRHLPACCVDRGEDKHGRARRLRHADRRAHPIRVHRPCADVENRGLREAAQHFVG